MASAFRFAWMSSAVTRENEMSTIKFYTGRALGFDQPTICHSGKRNVS
jgi:hypothetical protein